MSKLLRRTLHSLLMLAAAAVPALAQIPNGESDYKLAPAITGSRSRVFVGTQYGTILVATSRPDGISITDSLVAAAQLPAELRGIWHLSMPNTATNPDLITALVSYVDGASSRYGFLRSTDFGVSWTLVKDPALADTRFTPSNRFWDTLSLREITWLADAQHGWAYGPAGIIATTDGGATWSVRYTNPGRGFVQALAFRDPMNGVAAIGPSVEERFRATTDGGVTWAPRDVPLGLLRVNQIDWIGNEYRALLFDRSALSNRGKMTTFIYRSTDDGMFWDKKPKGNITVEQTYHTEMLWANARTGFMIMRSGEIAGTTNAGANFTPVQDADSTGNPMPIGTNRGFGYASIILDNQYIVQASTIRNDGALDTLVQWGVTVAAIAADRGTRVGGSIVPTPSRDRAVLSLDRPLTGAASMTIVDAAGRVHVAHEVPAGERALVIETGALRPGIYRVVVADSDERVGAPLVVTR
jgi:hypothetical protein